MQPLKLQTKFINSPYQRNKLCNIQLIMVQDES